MRYIWILIILFVLVSCRTSKKLTTKKEAEQDIQTSTNTIVKEKLDTNIVIPAKRANLVAPIDLLMKGDTAKKLINGIEIKTWFNNSNKTIETQAVSLPVSVPLQFDRLTTINSKTKSLIKEKSKTIEKEQPAGLSSFQGWLFLILLLGVVVLIVRFAP